MIRVDDHLEIDYYDLTNEAKKTLLSAYGASSVAELDPKLFIQIAVNPIGVHYICKPIYETERHS